MKAFRVVEVMGNSAGTVWKIFHEKLDMSKVRGRWVTRKGELREVS